MSSHATPPSAPQSTDFINYPNLGDRPVIPANDTSAHSMEPISNHKSVLKPIQKTALTVLLIGETGCGKTAFLSLLANLFKNIGHMDLKDQNDSSIESGLSKTESQTTKAKLYTLTTAHGATLNILDTPGLADTRGIEQDNEHKAEIHRAIQESVIAIDAVMILANGTTERLNVTTHYVLTVLSGMFPRSIVENIGLMFTNCDPLTWNFRLESLHPALQKSKHWMIQNPLAMRKNWEKADVEPAQKERMACQLKYCYDDTVSMLDRWFKWLDERRVQPTAEICRLFRLSSEIESRLEAAVFTITQLASQQAAYLEITKNLQNSESQKHAFEMLVEKKSERVWRREPTEEANTICLFPNCYRNCHAPCITHITGEPKSLGRWCKAFKHFRYIPSIVRSASAKCNECKHEAKHHGHYFSKHVQSYQMKDEELQGLKDAIDKRQGLETAQKVAQETLDRIDIEKRDAEEAIHNLINEFNDLALCRSFAGLIESAIEVMELRMEELKADPFKAREVRFVNQYIDRLRDMLSILIGTDGAIWDRTKSAARTATKFILNSPKNMPTKQLPPIA